MQNIKFISLFSACGFLLSFIFGFLSKSKFYIILLKALIFAVIFALLAFLISFLYNKFLKEEGAADLGTSGSSMADETTVTPESSSKGHNVDFVVQDAEFEKGDSENHFVVGETHQMLNSSDVSSGKPEMVTKNNESKFVPLKNFETVSNFSGKEAVHSDSVMSSISEPVGNEHEIVDVSSDSGLNNDGLNTGSSISDIDTLPDMGNLPSFSNEGNSANSSDDDIIGTDDGAFETSFSSSSSTRRSEQVAEVKDASLMAKAISSILSDENS